MHAFIRGLLLIALSSLGLITTQASATIISGSSYNSISFSASQAIYINNNSSSYSNGSAYCSWWLGPCYWGGYGGSSSSYVSAVGGAQIFSGPPLAAGSLLPTGGATTTGETLKSYSYSVYEDAWHCGFLGLDVCYSSSESSSHGGVWDGVAQGYLGFLFAGNDGLHYGWAQLTFGNDSSAWINKWAYESVAGVGVIVGSLDSLAPSGPVDPDGEVPEPASLALLALGLAGVCLGRRTRNA
ncbi:MAG: PEP-CTERM sorting domain-containing protein [Rhodocyclaceae bacterium]